MEGGRSPSTPDRRPFACALSGADAAPEVVGEKGAAIALMHALGLPVAPAFAVTVDARRAWAREGVLPQAARDEVARCLDGLGRGPTAGVAVRASAAHAGAPVPAARLGVPPEVDPVCRAVEDLWRAGACPAVAAVVQRAIPARADGAGQGVMVSRDALTGSPRAAGHHAGGGLQGLRRTAPEAHRALEDATVLLESTFGDMCEVAFAVTGGRLWLLGARRARRTGAAAIRVAVDLADEGLIGLAEALRRVPLWALAQAQAPVVAPDTDLDVLARGVAVAPGAGSGAVVVGTAAVGDALSRGDVVVVAGAGEAAAAVALRGVRAVVTTGPRRPWPPDVVRRPAVCHVGELTVDPERGVARGPAGAVLRAGDDVTVDGRAGLVARGRCRVVAAQPDARLARLLRWCDDLKHPAVATVAPGGWAHVRAPEDTRQARVARMLVDVPGGDDRWAAQRRLEELVPAATDAGAVELGLALPDELGGADPAPPPGPYSVVVAHGHLTWAARVLAARLPVVPSSRRFERAPASTSARRRTRGG